jgi:oligopeptide transport system permease protein
MASSIRAFGGAEIAMVAASPPPLPALAEPDLLTHPPRSLWQDALARLKRNRAARWSAWTLLFLLALALIGPFASPHGYEAINWDELGSPPNLAQGYLFGTDTSGRDLFARTCVGLGVSLAVGVLATLVSCLIGIAWGAIAGFAGGRVDQVMMRIVDVLYALPFLFFVILLMVVFGRNFVLVFVGVGAVEWLTTARIVRGQTLALKNREFVEAARTIGVAPARILTRHIVPNLLGIVAVYATLTVPQVILIESFLSFLGLGISEPLTSLGVLIKAGADDMELAPWMLLFPAAVLAVLLLALNFLGDGLRDALDPKERL